MSVIGTATVDVKVVPEAASLEKLAVEELRRAVARRQVLTRKLAVLQPELESVTKREEALKVVVGSEAFYEVTGSNEVRRVLKELGKYSYEEGGVEYGVRLSYLEWLLDKDGYKVPEAALGHADVSEKLVDVVTHYGEVTIFWYILRVMYDGKLDSFMETYAPKFGLRRVAE